MLKAGIHFHSMVHIDDQQQFATVTKNKSEL